MTSSWAAEREPLFLSNRLVGRSRLEKMANRAVFLDRDGVLIRDVHLLEHYGEVELCDGTPQQVSQLRDSGFAVVVVTNPSVVARGLASERDVELTHRRIQQLLRMSGNGELDWFYFCPHHPDATLPQYRYDCDCRKPRPGMLIQAAQELDLDLRSSCMVGDRVSDVMTGRSAGCETILIKTGMFSEPLPARADGETSIQPDHVCWDLAAAVAIILGDACHPCRDRRRYTGLGD